MTEGAPALSRATLRREPLIPAGVLGMLLFILPEIMLFAGLISAHAITRASAPGGIWPPPDQPRLPVEATAFNTLLLLLSGVALFLAGRALPERRPRARNLLVTALSLGSAFVALQGMEWVRLIREGLTLTSSTHGGFFYLIVGLHALHAVAAIIGLWVILHWMGRGTLKVSQLQTAQVFWYFVVLLWPVLYWRVYL